MTPPHCSRVTAVKVRTAHPETGTGCSCFRSCGKYTPEPALHRLNIWLEDCNIAIVYKVRRNYKNLLICTYIWLIFSAPLQGLQHLSRMERLYRYQLILKWFTEQLKLRCGNLLWKLLGVMRVGYSLKKLVGEGEDDVFHTQSQQWAISWTQWKLINRNVRKYFDVG